MKRWKLPLVIIAILAILAAAATLIAPAVRGTRGVQLLTPPGAKELRAFDRRQSAALFIGVRKFTRDGTPEVRFAADDAVDLAYLFALCPRVGLVPPERVVLALSGSPQKEESKRHLDELKQAGAKVEGAEPSDILLLLQRQAALAGKDGILIVSLATHGFVRDGVPYVLGSSSVFQYENTALPMPKLFDIAATSEARRSLFFIDACRERITGGTRGGPNPATAAPLMGRMGRVDGQIVFYAAAAGGYAYDRDDGNGVFTRAVIDGLSCKASMVRGAVTFATLWVFLERAVKTWIRVHRNPSIRSATQVSIDGGARNMPLSMCAGPPRPPPPGNVAHVEYEGAIVTAFSAEGTQLWQRDVKTHIVRARVADLDADGSREVVVGADAITVFDRIGARLWSVKEGLTLRELLVDDLLAKARGLQVVALWSDGRSTSRVSIYAGGGQRFSAYDHRGPLTQIAIDRPTSRHRRKIIVAGIDDQAGSSFGTQRPVASVFMLDAKSERVWAGVLFPFEERIARLEIVDQDNDAKRDISVSTASGSTFVLDFSGNVINRRNSSERLQFKLLSRTARR